MKQTKSKIIKNIKISKDYAFAIISAPKIAKAALPGQFVMVQVGNGLEPLLRRPLGVHQVDGENIKLLYEIVGKGTQILSQSKPGETLDIIGPLGKGFEYDQSSAINSQPILVAGGMGVAPLLFLADKLAKRKKHKIIVLIGARAKNHINCEMEFKKIGCAVKIATDDGSKGFKGRVTDLLRSVIARSVATKQSKEIACNDKFIIYACGPKPMLNALSKLSDEFEIPTQLSLEAHMSCGFGACLGCVVNTVDGYKRVCKEGPVFRSKEIIW